MCYTLIRSLNKHNFLKAITVWECIVWLLMTCWILLYHSVLKNWGELEEEVKSHTKSKLNPRKLKQEVDILKAQYYNALYFHTSLCFLFVLVTGILVMGLMRKSRCLIVTWIITNIMVGIARIVVLIIMNRVYDWLPFFELYWIPKSFFFAIAVLYCIELWGHQEDGEHLDHPILYSLEEDDARVCRGAHNYPEHPSNLDVRETVVGRGVGSTVLRDDALYKEYPMSYDVLSYEGKGYRVVDRPPYEHL